MSDTPFDSQNAAYAQILYEDFARNPESVPESWRAFFQQGPAVTRAAGLIVPEGLADTGATYPVTSNGSNGSSAAHAASAATATHLDHLLPLVARATSFVQAFRDHGHTQAEINPLHATRTEHPQLDPSFFGTSMEELETVPASIIMDEAQSGESVAAALRRLRRAYVGKIGYEFEHIDDPERVRWLWHQVE